MLKQIAFLLGVMLMCGEVNKCHGSKVQKNQEKSGVVYRLFKGSQVEPYLPFIQQVRLDWYRGFPYFYNACTQDAANMYTEFYKNKTESILVGAFKQDELVGWALGLPLKNVDLPDYCSVGQEVIAGVVKYQDIGVALDTCFYGSEVIMLPKHRDPAIEEELYNRFEQAIKEKKNYKHLGWFHLDLGDHHPRRPKDFVDIEKNLLQLHGFAKSGYKVGHEWDVIQADGSILPQQKFTMDLWIKVLDN